MAATILGWAFVDLDTRLEEVVDQTIPEIIKESGWDTFRDQELRILKTAMDGGQKRHVFACGGGIVESQEARRLLVDYHKASGLVIFVQRDIEHIMAFLQIDKTRPAYVDDMREVWQRRQPWYLECSNHQFYSPNDVNSTATLPLNRLEQFLRTITGPSRTLDVLKMKEQSFFVSLTVPDVAAAASILEEVGVGTDAVELRVDLLEDPRRRADPPSMDFVASQVAILRASTSLPIIFTVRTQSQGGKMPDNALEEIHQLLQLALHLGVEFLDLELHLPETILASITSSKRNTQIIASHHNPK
ncbi:MAG: hypothetical protein Q9183_007803, partial [Haloplaca sp. 2 TL-2023]